MLTTELSEAETLKQFSLSLTVFGLCSVTPEIVLHFQIHSKCSFRVLMDTWPNVRLCRPTPTNLKDLKDFGQWQRTHLHSSPAEGKSQNFNLLTTAGNRGTV